MAKQLTDLQQITKTALTDDDLIWIRDVSENRDKKATLGDVFGRTLEGWIAVVNDTWTYVSYDATKKTGRISVNAGGLGKYAVGQRLEFVQNNTTKYAVVIAQTDTTLDVLMLGSYALEDATISDAKYSQSFAPQTETGTNFFATLLQGQVGNLPVIVTAINEGDADVNAQEGYVILEMIIGEDEA